MPTPRPRGTLSISNWLRTKLVVPSYLLFFPLLVTARARRAEPRS